MSTEPARWTAAPAARVVLFVATVLAAVLLWRVTGNAVTRATWVAAVLIAAAAELLDRRRRSARASR